MAHTEFEETRGRQVIYHLELVPTNSKKDVNIDPNYPLGDIQESFLFNGFPIFRNQPNGSTSKERIENETEGDVNIHYVLPQIVSLFQSTPDSQEISDSTREAREMAYLYTNELFFSQHMANTLDETFALKYKGSNAANYLINYSIAQETSLLNLSRTRLSFKGRPLVSNTISKAASMVISPLKKEVDKIQEAYETAYYKGGTSFVKATKNPAPVQPKAIRRSINSVASDEAISLSEPIMTSLVTRPANTVEEKKKAFKAILHEYFTKVNPTYVSPLICSNGVVVNESPFYLQQDALEITGIDLKKGVEIKSLLNFDLGLEYLFVQHSKREAELSLNFRFYKANGEEIVSNSGSLSYPVQYVITEDDSLGNTAVTRRDNPDTRDIEHFSANNEFSPVFVLGNSVEQPATLLDPHFASTKSLMKAFEKYSFSEQDEKDIEKIELSLVINQRYEKDPTDMFDNFEMLRIDILGGMEGFSKFLATYDKKINCQILPDLKIATKSLDFKTVLGIEKTGPDMTFRGDYVVFTFPIKHTSLGNVTTEMTPEMKKVIKETNDDIQLLAPKYCLTEVHLDANVSNGFFQQFFPKGSEVLIWERFSMAVKNTFNSEVLAYVNIDSLNIAIRKEAIPSHINFQTATSLTLNCRVNSTLDVNNPTPIAATSQVQGFTNIVYNDQEVTKVMGSVVEKVFLQSYSFYLQYKGVADADPEKTFLAYRQYTVRGIGHYGIPYKEACEILITEAPEVTVVESNFDEIPVGSSIHLPTALRSDEKDETPDMNLKDKAAMIQIPQGKIYNSYQEMVNDQ